MKSNKYRRDIDGLRAIAVISVLLFHGGFNLFSGGYVGVDIFFVISGYLITSLILSEKNEDSFSLINFYERRIRRIFPALFFVTIISTLFSLMLMPPKLLVEFAQSIISVPLFLSNFLFWSLGGYFVTASEEVPLLHTWSLAVEEQYYLIFPIFIIVFWSFGKKFIIVSILIISLLSILLAQLGANISPTGSYFLENDLKWNAVPDFAFYLTPSRAWEILLGALTAFYLNEKNTIGNKNINSSFSFLGIFLIIVSIITFDNSTPFPSLYTLFPTLGTVMLIITSTPGSIVNRLLSFTPFVGIGLISYSTYLWHQPLLAYTRIIKSNSLSNIETLLILFCSIILGYLSWKFIENPFRNKNIFKRKFIFNSALLSSVLIIIIGIIIIINDGFESRYSKKEMNLVEPQKFNLSICSNSNPIKSFPKISFCSIGNTESKSDPTIFYGDSHMDSLINSINNQLVKNNLRGIKIFNEYCEPMVFIYREKNISLAKQNICTESHKALLSYLKEINSSNIFILFRWTLRLYPIDEYIESLTFDNEEGGKEYIKNYREYYGLGSNGLSKSYEAKLNSINKFIDSFAENNLNMTILYPIPESGWNLPKYNNTKIKFNKKIPDTMSTDYNLYLQRNRFILNVLDGINENKLINKIKSQDIFCNSFLLKRCIIQLEGLPLYYDYDHLSNYGADLITNEIFKKIYD